MLGSDFVSTLMVLNGIFLMVVKQEWGEGTGDMGKELLFDKGEKAFGAQWGMNTVIGNDCCVRGG